MKKAYFSLAVLLACTLSVQAEVDHAFILNVGGGTHNLFYNNVEDLTSGTSYNLGVEVGYRLYFHQHWGVGLNVGVSNVRSKSAFAGMTTFNGFDAENNMDYVGRTYFSEWSERLNVLQVDIPLLFTFRHGLSGDWAIVTNFGPKVHIPVSVKYTAAGQLDQKRYYPAYNVEMSDLPQHGFSKSDAEFKGKTEMSIYPSFYVDLGVARVFTANWMSNRKYREMIGNVYMGVYVDCGYLPVNGSLQTMYEYVDNSAVYHSLQEQKFVKSAVPLSCGIKIGISIMSDSSYMRWLYK